MTALRPALLLAVFVGALLQSIGVSAQSPAAFVAPELLRQLQFEERDQAPKLRVIVNFETPGTREIVPEPAQVQSVRLQLLARLPSASYRQVASFDRIRAVSLEVNAQALEILRRTPGVTAINLDREVHTTMIQANALTGVATLHSSGFTGDGQVVAIIDTGVDSNAGVVHPGLADDLVGQACFRTENDCIGGAISAEDQDGHGTHVAGMITGPNGVAPDAQFHALKVFTTGSTSDTNILNALNHVIGLNTTTPGAVDMINMSLGGGNFATGAACDAAGAAYVSAFATLNSQGTSVFVATGNDAQTGQVSSPACITGAIGVGSTGDANFSLSFSACTDNGAPDKVSCYSNATPVQGVGELVDLLAPGCEIISLGLNNGVAATSCGTSMATPYAAGSAALVLEFLQGEGLSFTPAQLEDVLESTGKPVLDYRIAASPQYPRVDPVATVGALSFASPPTGFTITGTTSTSISMSWTGVPEATQYRVYRNVAGAAPVQVGTTTAPTVSFTDNSAICGPQTYFVRAFDGSALSLPSNEDTDTSRACPLTPTSLVATPVSSTAVTLSWTDANADETAQILQRSLNGGAFADYQTLAPGTSLSFPDTALACGVYQYRAMAQRGADRSAPSNVVQFAACAPANDNFVNAENIVADVAITDVEANVSSASEEPADPVYSCKFGGAGAGFQGLWYRITPTAATRVTVSTAATTLTAPAAGVPDTLAAIYTHNGSAFTEIACNDDIGGSNFRSSVSSNLAAGTTYYVFISQWAQVPPGTVGNVSTAFSWSAPTVVPDNDLVANARVISAMPYNNTVVNAQFATTSVTDLPHSCAFNGARIGTHTLWWTFTPATNGLLDIDTLASSGSFTDTIMTVYSGTPGSFTVVGCNDDEPAPGATLRSEILDLALTAGTQYTVYVSRWSNTPTVTVGTVVLNASFETTIGPPSQLAIGVQPGNTVAGVSIAPAITVNILDSVGAQTNSTANVTLAIGANPGTGTLSGTTTVAAVNGVATFSGLSIDKAGTGYTLAASSPTLTGATSNAFNITPAAPAALAFLQQPTNTAGGAAVSPAITVQALDAFGNLTGYTGNVTLAIGSNPSGGALSGTATVAAVAGIATFGGLSINTAGTGYTLAASASGLTGAASSAFNITVGAPAQLAFGQQPSNTASTAAITPAPTVRILDAGGNLTMSTASVTLAIGSNPSGGALSGTTTVAAVAGIATFPGLSINTAGAGYTLAASSGALTGATSSAFNISVGAPAQLAFAQQPSNTAGGAVITPAPTVRILDAGGNLTASTANVTLAIGSNPGTGTLSGTVSVAAVAGVATFSNLSINTAGTGYTLAANSGALTGATSTAFNITVGAPAQLAFGQQPSNTASTAAITPAPTVRILDAGGNLTASTANVTLAIGTNPSSGTLSGTTTVAAVGGLASFAGLSINTAGNGYTLVAGSGALSGATSNAFDITAGAPAQLVFGQQPTNTAGGATITPAPTVRILDAGGNLTGSTANVTLAIGSNPSGGSLSGTATVVAIGGVATFSTLSINTAGSGYTLAASSGALTGATSNGFDITVGTPAQLVFAQQPSNTAGGATITPAPTVRILDAGGNLTASTANVALAIGSNPSGGALSGTATVAAVAGIATFNGLSINTAGTGYTLAASGGALTGATSNAFNITVGAPAQLAFAQQPGNTASTAAITPPPTVRILDAGGNLTASTANVTLAIGTNPSSGTLSGSATVAAVAGVASFPGLSINTAGTGYTLAASSGVLTGATSNAFNITVGAPAQLAFAQQPSNTAGGATITPSPTVRILDAGGNLTGSTANVTLGVGSNPSSGTLSGTATVAAVAGVATFSNLSINTAGTGYTLAASSGALTGATSSAFNITVGAAAQLAFGQQPSNASANLAIAPAPTVRILDAGGNLTASTANITVAIGSNPGTSTLGGTPTIAAVAGIATFSDLTLNNGGNGYTLTAASAGLTGATSSAFNINCPTTVVTSSNDSGAGSLRQIIADACPGSTITFAPGVDTVTLTTAEIFANKSLTINGGAGGVTITRSTAPGTPDFRLINFAGASAALSNLTISNGVGSSFGGGVRVISGNLIINDSVVRNNRLTGEGGGGHGISVAFGNLTMTRTLVEGNQGAFGSVTIQNGSGSVVESTIRNNSGRNAGFRLLSPSGPVSLINSTISGNVAIQGPAGIGFFGAPVSLTVSSSTISDNQSTDAAIAGSVGNAVTLINSIVSGNSLAGGTPADSLLAFDATSTNNLIGTGGGLTNGVDGNIVGVNNPLVSASGNFGGPVPTVALLPGSPAINAGNNAGAPATDQRGFARPEQGTVDIGAFESRGFTLAVSGGNNQSAGPGLAFASPLALTVTPIGVGEPVNGGVVTFTPPGAGASASLAPNPVTIAGGSASTSATANATVGSYTVGANAAGSSGGVNFTLTNAAADLSIDDVAITEGNAATSNAVFTVTRTNALTAFSVPYSITAGTAQLLSDYNATSGTLSFTVGGGLTQTITVPVVGDLIVEATETATLNLGAVSNTAGVTTITDGSGLLTITDNDSAVVAFDPISVSQTEATSPMAFTVSLSNPVQSGVTLSLNSANGTATAADFTPITGATVTFAPNTSASQTVNVVINNDALDEDDETFSLTLSGLSAIGNVTSGTLIATGTILDDDLPPVISITSPSQLEGNAGNTPMNFVVSLSAVSGRDVSFTRATANGSATLADNDYLQLLPAGATILAGQTSLPITVQIVGDTTFEGNESFNLNLTNIVNATVAVPPGIEGVPAGLSGTGTIEDDDQQPTTTTITSDLPDASVVGQPYTVVVGVTAVSTSPLGTISISDGTDSCGPVTLTTSAAPNSTASCLLTSTTAGAKTLTASYTPASTAFAASSDTEAHAVNAATTAISVVGPVRSRINQPTTFTFALSVNAPGAGSPAGTVTLTSGAATCNVTVPTVTPSCALTFTTLGSRTVSAAFAPSNGNYLASSSSGAGNAQTLVYALSDIAVTKTDLVGTYRPGDLLVYTVTVRNLGADAAANIRVRDQIPAGLINVDWTCDASGGVACPAASGSGNLDLTVAAFPVSGLLNFSFFGNVSGSPAQLVNTALVELPADTTIEDPNLGNNSASDTNLLEFLFRNGFEDPLVNAPTGSYRLPSLGLRGALDEVARVVYVLDDANGEAVRVYARLFGDEVQYALASRDAAGQLRLAAWRSYSGEPILSWTARQVGTGWVLESVTLR